MHDGLAHLQVRHLAGVDADVAVAGGTDGLVADALILFAVELGERLGLGVGFGKVDLLVVEGVEDLGA